ncbi:CHAT domain-containing protein [Streptomyces sp. NPDC002328]|uniref:CHAT domain-containing protein n=1 Tax=Streptomyces sp. NPDC002328 TaxID=3364642 RepID=UPI0036B3ABF4
MELPPGQPAPGESSVLRVEIVPWPGGSEDPHDLPEIVPVGVMILFTPPGVAEQRTAHLTTLADLMELLREDSGGPAREMAREVICDAVADAALARQSSRTRIAVRLLVAEILAVDAAEPERALSVARTALEEARATEPPGSAAGAEAALRLGRLLIHLGADDEHRDAGLRLLEESAGVPGSRFRGDALAAISTGLVQRFVHSKDLSHLQRAITAARSAVDEASPNSPDERGRETDLGAMLTARFQASQDGDDLREAVKVLSGAVDASPEDDPQLASRRHLLLETLRMSIHRRPSRSDLDLLIATLGATAQGDETGPEMRRELLRELAHVLDLRWQHYQRLPDLRHSTDVLTELLDETADDDPMRPELLAALAMAVFRQAETGGDASSIDRSLTLINEALALPPPEPQQTVVYQRHLAVILRARAARDRRPEDLEQAITLLENCVATAHADGFGGVSQPLGSLGLALLARYELGGAATSDPNQADEQSRTGDLDRAIEALASAAAAPDDNAYGRVTALKNLLHAVGIRYTASGRPDDLAWLSDLGRQLRKATEDDASITGVSTTRHLAVTLEDRLDAIADPSTLDEAVAVLEREFSQAEPGSAHAYETGVNLALNLWRSYVARGGAEALRRAIALLEDAVAHLPPGSRDRAEALGMLGMCLRDRYIHDGVSADLDQAVSCHNEALPSYDPGEEKYAEIAGNLALALWDRYGRTGNLHDLDRSIALLDTVLDSPPQATVRLTGVLNTLGIALRDRYHSTRDPRDLHRAVEVHERASDLPAAARLTSGGVLNNYGAALMDRYRTTHDLTDLLRAVDVFEQSLDVAHPESPNRPRFLVNLAGGLQARYDRLRDVKDLDRAIELTGNALAEAPPGWVNMSTSLMSLATLLHMRYRQLGRRHDRRAALEAYRKGCRSGLNAQAGATLRSARSWLEWVFQEGAWDDAAEAAGVAGEAMIRLFESQYGRTHKERWLRTARGIPSLSAYVLAAKEEQQKAVVALESGRALQMSEVLERDRAQLDDLIGEGHVRLVERYRRANDAWADQLRSGESRDTIDPDTASFAPEHALEQSRRELDEAITMIRAVRPGFLRPSTFADVVTAARTAPLVYLATTNAGGVALLVRADGTTETVWLPDLTERDVTRRVSDLRRAHDGCSRDPAVWRGTLDAVCSWLWDHVMAAVLDRLGPAARAILIPAGTLGLLPLHAAWTADASRPTGRRYAVDDCSLAYAPNARSVKAAQDIADRAVTESLLTVEDPRPSKQTPLPFTVPEVAAARACFPTAKGFSREAATVADVTAALPAFRVHHFACHGIANLSEPLKSALILADDEPLTLEALLRLRLLGEDSEGVRLVVLSSCESLIPGLELPDEVVSLPTGLLQSGAAGVMATQWAVTGLATSLLMGRFHRERRVDPAVSPATALRSAQQWLRDTTNGEKLADLRADDVLPREAVRPWRRELLRKPPHERSFAHLSEWAAFSHVGV